MTTTDQTREVDVRALHRPTLTIPVIHLSWTKRRLVQVLLSYALVLLIGTACGYIAGSSHAARISPRGAGWLLKSVTINGKTVDADRAIYIAWDIAAHPHDPGATWYIVTVTAKGIVITAIPINALSDGEGRITLSIIIPGGETTVYGTVTPNSMQILVPPKSRLFPGNEFVTLSFVPSTPDVFNRLLTTGGT